MGEDTYICESLPISGNMYDVPLLMEKCGAFVRTDLEPTNYIEYSNIGMFYGDQSPVLSEVLKWLGGTYLTMERSPDLTNASPELMVKIAEGCERSVNCEDKLFNAVSKFELVVFHKN